MKTDFVTLLKYLEPMEAHILKGRLEAEGIPCFLGDENIMTLNPFYGQAVGGVKLKVNARDVQRATEILAIDKLFTHTDYFQEESEETGAVCPKCNLPAGRKTAVSGFSKALFVISTILFVPLPYFNSKLKCTNCGYEWKHVRRKNS